MNRFSFIAGCAALLLLSMESMGTTIYKSVDAEGRVTFSDQPPPGDEVVDVLEYREPGPTTSALDRERIEAMREVTERMAADRREREADRARARAARQQAAPSSGYPGDTPEADYDRTYTGFYPAYRVRKPRPGFRPPHARPPHVRPPVARPPVQRPPEAGDDSGQAVGFNSWPASLIRRHYTSAARRVFYREPVIVR